MARLLFVRRWTREQIEELLQFLDWIMTLPEELEGTFEARYTEMEKVETMAETMPPLIRRAQARGALNEARELLFQLGRKRLGEPGAEVENHINAIMDRERLRFLCRQILDVETWAELLTAE